MPMTMVPTSKLKQYDIINGAGEDMGQVQNFMVDMGTGRICYVVAAFGGFLGLTDKWLAVPFELLCWNAAKDKLILDVPRAVLEKAPTMDKAKWPDKYLEGDEGWLDNLYGYYKCPPYWEVEGEKGVSLGMTVKTGSAAPASGVYRFVHHDGQKGKTECSPSMDEREIPLAKGERVPPVRSCGKGATWKLVRAA
jgi:sporulation protein YlmC with PRC-barrel domain